MTDELPKQMLTSEVREAKPAIAVLPVAGRGSRLYQVARQPKPLTPVGGMSLGEHAVQTFVKELGIEHFIAVVGYEADRIKTHFRHVAVKYGAEIEFVKASNWHLGNGASTLSVKERTGDLPFYLSMVDLLFDAPIARILGQRVPAEGEVCVAVDKDRRSIFDADDVVGVKLDGDHISNMGTSMRDWDAAVLGLFLCTNGLFEGIERAASRGCHELNDAFQELLPERLLLAVDVTGHRWLDVDTPEVHEESERRLASS